MTSRTLSRRLQGFGITYTELVNSVRKELTLQYLSKTTWSIADIAEHLGYLNASNFTRAFKHWTGQTPHDYRKKAPRD